MRTAWTSGSTVRLTSVPAISIRAVALFDAADLRLDDAAQLRVADEHAHLDAAARAERDDGLRAGLAQHRDVGPVTIPPAASFGMSGKS